jgi:hypothetical protein
VTDDQVVDDSELDELVRFGKPQGGDDSQMVAFRTIARAMARSIKTQRSALERLREIEKLTKKCNDTFVLVNELVTVVKPPNADEHIDVRIKRLERISSGLVGMLYHNIPMILMLIAYGAWFLLGKVQ